MHTTTPRFSTNPSRISTNRSAIITSVMMAGGLLAAACGSAAASDGDRAIADIPETTIAASAADDSTSSDPSTDSGDGERSDQPVSEEDAEAAQLRFDQCLADEGVENPFDSAEDGEGAVVEFDDGEFEKFDAAQKKCEPILEDVFGSFELTPDQEAAAADAELAFNQCMTEQGFDMSDSEGQGGFQVDGDVDVEELNAAAETCNEVFDGVFGDSDSEEGQDSDGNDQ